MLDWMLLASFRERLRLIRAYNRLAQLEREKGVGNFRYREVNVTIVSPKDFFSIARIIDYDEYSSELIDLGYKAAQQAFLKQFSV